MIYYLTAEELCSCCQNSLLKHVVVKVQPLENLSRQRSFPSTCNFSSGFHCQCPDTEWNIKVNGSNSSSPTPPCPAFVWNWISEVIQTETVLPSLPVQLPLNLPNTVLFSQTVFFCFVQFLKKARVLKRGSATILQWVQILFSDLTQFCEKMKLCLKQKCNIQLTSTAAKVKLNYSQFTLKCK